MVVTRSKSHETNKISDKENGPSRPIIILTQYLVFDFLCRIGNYSHDKYLKNKASEDEDTTCKN